METSEKIEELAAALSKAQGEMSSASKDKANPFFKSKYADLASCWDSCRGPLSKNNIAIIQTTSPGEGKEIVITTLMVHASGEWIKSELPMEPVKSDPQGIGSAITYGRRYALMGMVGIAPAEDDGEGAMGRGKPKVNYQAIMKGILSLESPADFAKAKIEISSIKNEQERKKAGAAFNASMKNKGIYYSGTDDNFSRKGAGWYQGEADKKKDIASWWRAEAGQAKEDLSEIDLAKVESYVKQLIKISQPIENVSEEASPQWSPAAKAILDVIGKKETAKDIDDYRGKPANRGKIDSLGGEAAFVYQYIENAYQALRGEQ